jgi:prophage regulatory protein
MAEVKRFLRRREVERITSLPRSTIYERMAAGAFPRPVRIGQKTVGWLESEIQAWIAQRIAARDGTAPQGQRPEQPQAAE